jgi:hypothetical protein
MSKMSDIQLDIRNIADELNDPFGDDAETIIIISDTLNVSAQLVMQALGYSENEVNALELEQA